MNSKAHSKLPKRTRLIAASSACDTRIALQMTIVHAGATDSIEMAPQVVRLLLRRLRMQGNHLR
jgi:hypothetical protein